ncbi:MAG: imidazolonepropionase [Myxococcales bacterium]|nr:imidazolonepropionase [Myxococcales bacterium]
MLANERVLIGPFSQILSLSNLALTGPLSDHQLEVINEGGVIVAGQVIERVDLWSELKVYAQKEGIKIHRVEDVFAQLGKPCPKHLTLTPGLVDAHTHICYAGSRARDYADRLNGVSYETISARGGGICDTMQHTRKASEDELFELNIQRVRQHLARGVTTVEIKSGYGLSVADELKQLRVIKKLSEAGLSKVISSCLAAHVLPPEFKDTSVARHEEYLSIILNELLPIVKKEKLAQRVDAFVEPSAFPVSIARSYLKSAQKMGFDLCVHADQFSRGGAKLAAELGAKSADHLEASTSQDLQALKAGNVTAVALPGASIGLGIPYTPAREALDLGLSLAIASDWNPGSAPMGHLLMQASILGAAEKLSAAEVWAGISSRAAHALSLTNVGQLKSGFIADMIAFPCDDYREILYHQGMLQPSLVWTQGDLHDL